MPGKTHLARIAFLTASSAAMAFLWTPVGAMAVGGADANGNSANLATARTAAHDAPSGAVTVRRASVVGQTLTITFTGDLQSIMVDVNLGGAYHCARGAIPYLKQRGGGKMILIGSGLGHRGTPERSAYACSKAAVWMLTRVLAEELWPYHITVNELIPGPVQTSIDGGRPDDKNAVSRIASEWNKAPEDVAPMALFLATQPATGPTGQSFSLMRRSL